MYYHGQLETRRDAVVIAEMELSSVAFAHRMGGRRSAESYGKTWRPPMAEEKSILIWRCDILQCCGWLQTPADVRAFAHEVVQSRGETRK